MLTRYVGLLWTTSKLWNCLQELALEYFEVLELLAGALDDFEVLELFIPTYQSFGCGLFGKIENHLERCVWESSNERLVWNRNCALEKPNRNGKN